MHRTDYLIAQRCRGRVLELGCRDGRRSSLIDMLGSDVLGVDEDNEQIALAQARVKECCLNHCHFKSIDADWAGPEGFDTIVVSSSSEAMMKNLPFEEIERFLAPTGQIIMAIPNSTHLLGDRRLSIPAMEALWEDLSRLFPIVEDIRDDYTEWRLSVFRRDAEMAKPGPPRPSSDAALAPRVSVIMATYNRGHMISKAIDSVLSQTYPNIELIVVNDGSTDSTRETLEAYGSRLVAIHKPRNEGISAATNTGLVAASGDFVHRFDDDDVMFPRKIECQVRKFGTNPALGLVYTAAYVQSSVPGKRSFGRMGRFIPLSQYALAPSIEVLNSATLIKRTCLDGVGLFDTKLAAMEECDRFIRIMARHEYQFMPIPGVLYIKHGGNFTIEKREVIVESGRKIHQDMTSQMGIDALFKDIARIEDDEERRRQYSMAFLRRGKFGHAKGCHESACQDFEHALTYAPDNMAARKYLKKAREALASSQGSRTQPEAGNAGSATST